MQTDSLLCDTQVQRHTLLLLLLLGQAASLLPESPCHGGHLTAGCR
jgi:hypothetical protein